MGVRALLEAGCAKDQASNKGKIPLALLEYDLLCDLLEEAHAGDQPGHNGITPLFLAAAAGRSEMVCALLNAGCSKDQPAALGVTPLVAATAAGHAEVTRVLLDAGC